MTDATPGRRFPPRARRLAFAAAATLAATVWASVQDDDAAATMAPSRPQRRSVAPASAYESVANTAQPWPDVARVESRAPWKDAAPQGLVAWGPAPPPPAPPAPPAPPPTASAPPQAPDFPYTLIGRLDDGQARALLTNRTRSFGAKVADVIDGIWRVDSVDADGVTLTWLPGGISRTLVFPSS